MTGDGERGVGSGERGTGNGERGVGSGERGARGSYHVRAGEAIEGGACVGEVRRFEDLVAWQLARELTGQVYAMTRQGTFSRDFGLTDQMRRAAVSVMSNIAEGFERESIAERLHFYVISKASCAELRSQLYVALDAGHVDQATVDALQAKAERTARVLAGLRSSTRRGPHPPTNEPVH